MGIESSPSKSATSSGRPDVKNPSVWFVTGASRGIGAELARAVLNAGHSVVATGRNPSAVADALSGDRNSPRLLVHSLDVSNPAQAEAATAAAIARFGRIDVLVNNAGYGQLGYFEEIAASQIDLQFATNVFGLMHVTRAVLPVMRKQRAGRILNVASMAGAHGIAGASIYCSSKFAVEGFSAALALEVEPFGIKVTVVEPGSTRTDFLDNSSVHFGAHVIDDYSTISAALRSSTEQYSHQQGGDPARVAAALLELAGAEEPPLHFPTGSDALARIRAALERRLGEMKQWASLSDSVDRM